MRGPKFSTVVNAGGFEMLVKGKARSISDAINRAHERLERISGLKISDCLSNVYQLPRTGDNIRMRVTWQANAPF